MKILKTIICREWEHKLIAAQIIHYSSWYDEFWITETNYTVRGKVKNYIFDINKLKIDQKYLCKVKHIRIDSRRYTKTPPDGAPITSFESNQRLFRGQFVQVIDPQTIKKSIFLSVDSDEFVDIEALQKDTLSIYPMKCYRLNNFMFRPYLWEKDCLYYGPTLIHGSYYSQSPKVIIYKAIVFCLKLISPQSNIVRSPIVLIEFITKNIKHYFTGAKHFQHWRYEGLLGKTAEGIHLSWHCNKEELINKFNQTTGHSSSCISKKSIQMLHLIEEGINPFTGKELKDLRKSPGPNYSSAIFIYNDTSRQSEESSTFKE